MRIQELKQTDATSSRDKAFRQQRQPSLSLRCFVLLPHLPPEATAAGHTTHESSSNCLHASLTRVALEGRPPLLATRESEGWTERDILGSRGSDARDPHTHASPLTHTHAHTHSLSRKDADSGSGVKVERVGGYQGLSSKFGCSSKRTAADCSSRRSDGSRCTLTLDYTHVGSLSFSPAFLSFFHSLAPLPQTDCLLASRVSLFALPDLRLN